MLAKRTLLVRQVDDTIGSRLAEELVAEANSKHQWVYIFQVIKLPGKTRMFKVECQDTSAAIKVLEEGLCMFNIRIYPGQIC